MIIKLFIFHILIYRSVKLMRQQATLLLVLMNDNDQMKIHLGKGITNCLGGRSISRTAEPVFLF